MWHNDRRYIKDLKKEFELIKDFQIFLNGKACLDTKEPQTICKLNNLALQI